MLLTCAKALELSKFPKSHDDYDTYCEGFRSGWYDKYFGHRSMTALTSHWGKYATGYSDGWLAYSYYSPLKEEGGVTCLKSLLA